MGCSGSIRRSLGGNAIFIILPPGSHKIGQGPIRLCGFDVSLNRLANVCFQSRKVRSLSIAAREFNDFSDQPVAFGVSLHHNCERPFHAFIFPGGEFPYPGSISSQNNSDSFSISERGKAMDFQRDNRYNAKIPGEGCYEGRRKGRGPR